MGVRREGLSVAAAVESDRLLAGWACSLRTARGVAGSGFALTFGLG